MSAVTNMTIEEAQTKLVELIDRLRVGDEVIITKDNRPVARLVGTAESTHQVRRLGTLRGTVTYMADDFDAPLDEFKEYMP
jgi:prevent-host-death family protein